jgi:Lon protease-like protein
MTRAVVAAALMALSCVPALAQAPVDGTVIVAHDKLRGRMAKGQHLAAFNQTIPPSPPAARLPSAIPLFPLGDIMLFPNAERPLLIFEPRYRAMVADALKGDRIIGMIRLRPGFEADYEGRPPIDAVGCAGVITDAEQLPDGRYTIVLRGLTKFRVLQEDTSRPYRLARVDAVPEAAVAAADRAALAVERRQMTDLLALQNVELASDPKDEQAIDTVAQYLEMTPAERQALLEMDGVLVRARALVSKLNGR